MKSPQNMMIPSSVWTALKVSLNLRKGKFHFHLFKLEWKSQKLILNYFKLFFEFGNKTRSSIRERKNQRERSFSQIRGFWDSGEVNFHWGSEAYFVYPFYTCWLISHHLRRIWKRLKKMKAKILNFYCIHICFF